MKPDKKKKKPKDKKKKKINLTKIIMLPLVILVLGLGAWGINKVVNETAEMLTEWEKHYGDPQPFTSGAWKMGAAAC